ncbi:nucleolar protein 56 [Elysia marginata]|uniref:Nucleolar protein 56 n=1 Tax=Elysia marginata TaxID=1093978 RepID=A0AAV4ENL7_9GAST|nr:nucleolar protein 56 [Elysia marginata]
MSKLLFILFEHAAGYSLFSVKEFDEVATLLPQVESSVTDISKFQSVVKLNAFQPFRNGPNSLDNINAIAAGELHPDLQSFLEKEVPKGKKKVQVILGVGDAKIGAAISDTLGLSCQHTGVVVELMRGIRQHFSSFIKALTETSAGKAQLGLGHSYSRDKVKFNVNRVDNMIIQSISLLDQLDKDINTFSMRIREWYSYHFPELVKIVNDNYIYARLANMIGDRTKLTTDMEEPIEEIVMDSAKVKAIFDASKSSMGFDIGAIDLISIQAFSRRVISLTEYRKSLAEYLTSKMSSVAPNLAALIGEQVGARLISHAGSLTNLAKYPASTVQILGAEKALFRFIMSGTVNIESKTGVSYVPTSVIGEHLKQQVEDRLKFYETGETPAKNLDVMRQAVSEADNAKGEALKAQKKLAKKEKKRKLAEMNGDPNATLDTTNGDMEADGEPEKKKKKKKKDKGDLNDSAATSEVNVTVEETTPAKKSKKKKNQDEEQGQENETSNGDDSAVKKKKKKKDKEVDETSGVDTSLNITAEDADASAKKSKKKKKSKE